MIPAFQKIKVNSGDKKAAPDAGSADPVRCRRFSVLPENTVQCKDTPGIPAVTAVTAAADLHRPFPDVSAIIITGTRSPVKRIFNARIRIGP